MFDPRTFLRIAGSLAATTNDEAVLRTAVGRALYTVFLYAREGLEQNGVVVKEVDPVRLSLEHGNVRTVDGGMAAQAIDDARYCLERLSSLFPQSPTFQ